MKKHSLYALATAALLAGGMSVTSASAADLGGNCCADLEERIAELEATTARKGNRKVSLTVSGWVNQQVTFWDNGEESNAYVHDLGSTLGSHVKFTGSAAITPGWSAGYVLQIEAMGSDGLTHSENESVGPGVYQLLGGATNGYSVQTLQSFWFIKSETLGKVSVGLQSQASDNTAILVDGSGSLVPANWVAFDTNSMGMTGAGAGAGPGTWGHAQSCAGMGGAWGDCNGLTQNSVRYDSPTFGGFSVSASWGSDDFWDIAARYAGEFAGLKVAAAAAYNETTDGDYNNVEDALGLTVPDMDYFQAGLYVQHVASGIFGMVNYGNLSKEAGTGSAALNAVGRPDAETWYGKIGVRTRLSSLGHSVFYGEYLNGQDGSLGGPNSELEVWGAGIVQEVDAAAMSVWLKYRNLSYTDDAVAAAGGVNDFDYVGIGALINF